MRNSIIVVGLFLLLSGCERHFDLKVETARIVQHEGRSNGDLLEVLLSSSADLKKEASGLFSGDLYFVMSVCGRTDYAMARAYDGGTTRKADRYLYNIQFPRDLSQLTIVKNIPGGKTLASGWSLESIVRDGVCFSAAIPSAGVTSTAGPVRSDEVISLLR